MKISIPSEIYYRLKEISKIKPENVGLKLQELIKNLKPSSGRTSQQNKAIHKDCDIIAQKLNDAGLEIPKIVEWYMNIPWTYLSVKELIWKPTQALTFQKESTTQLDKHGEIEEIHKIIMRELGEKWGVEYHEFPHDPKKKKDFIEMHSGSETKLDYPTDYEGEPLI